MSNEQSHFSEAAGGQPTAVGRYVDVDLVPAVEFLAGLKFQPILGQNTMLNFVTFDRNVEAPQHVHEEEQVVLVLEGEFEFNVDGDVRTMRAGDVAVIPPWVPHGARTYDTTCREVDVFNPPRRTLLDLAKSQVSAAPDIAGQA